jgi:hypothetical protein
MRCAECGYKITDKPIKRDGKVFCSVECAEAAADVIDEDFDDDEPKYRRFDDDSDGEDFDDSEDRFAYSDEDDDDDR